jgi:hypothetical protein
MQMKAKCPICRAPIQAIHHYGFRNTVAILTAIIDVVPNDQAPQVVARLIGKRSVEEIQDMEAVLDAVRCVKCQRHDDEERLLVCDRCRKA